MIFRTRLCKVPNVEGSCMKIYGTIIRNAENSIFMQNFYNFGSEINFRCTQCIRKYNKLTMFDSIDICVSTMQDRGQWEEERKYRVTGSRCYDLYTFSKNDWEEKCSKYFFPKHFSNIYTKHSIKCEPMARKGFRVFYTKNRSCDM